MAETPPLVSVVIAAYNRAAYLPRCIESVLNQADPGGPFEVIVVDDGSTDDTPQILARYGSRLRTVHQPNGGPVKAFDTGLGYARGQFIALHDADDEMPPERLAFQVGELMARPRCGLVYSDMVIIDDSGELVDPSFFSYTSEQPHSGRILGKLLARCCVAGGSAMFRRSLLPAFWPMIPEAGFQDWTIAAGIAAVAEIQLCGGITNRYRQHAGNLGLNIDAEKKLIAWRDHELNWRIWMLRNLVDDDSVTAADLREAYVAFNNGIVACALRQPGGARSLLQTDPAAAARILCDLPAPGRGAPRSRALIRALTYDPFDMAIALDLVTATQIESELGAPPASPPLFELVHREHVVLTKLEQVLRQPQLLLNFAHDAAEDPTRTLVILAPRGSDTGQLERLFDAEPALQAESCDVTVITEPRTPPSRAWLESLADGWLESLADGGPDSDRILQPAMGAST